MQLFHKRPLCLILCILLGGFVIFTRGGSFGKALVIIAAVILTIASALLFLLKRRNYILISAAIALIISALFSNIYFDSWFYADKRFEDRVKVKGTVTEIVSLNTYSGHFIIKTDNIEDSLFSAYKFSVYLDGETSGLIDVGSVISFSCNIEPHSNKESETYRYSKGISAVCENVSDFKVHEQRRVVVENILDRARMWLTRHAISVSDEDTGNLVSALLFGERNSLSPEVNLDFKRLGITHILALSGMHLALLSLAADKILSLLQVHKKLRVTLTTMFAVMYMAFTGFSTSVVRAGLMLIISSILFLLAREPDPITSLFVAVTIIILISPYAIYDIALWLSAFATLGVIMYSEWERSSVKRKNKKINNKIIYAAIESLGISAFSITATLFITHFSFDGISVLSPIATLIFTILTTVIMYLGALMLLIGKLIPIGFILSPIVKFTNKIAEIMSSKDVYVSKEYHFVEIIVVALSVLFFLFLILNIKRKKLAVASLLLIFCTLYITVGILGQLKNSDDVISYNTYSNSNNFIVRSKGEICLVSSSKYAKTTGYNALNTLEELQITQLNKYYITHLSRNLEEELDVVLSNILTSEVYIPTPENEEEKAIVDKLKIFIQSYRTKICLYDSFSKIEVGDFEIIPVYSTAYGEGSTETAFFIHGKKENLLYLSSGMLEGENKEIALESLQRASSVVLGSYGKKYKNNIYLEADLNLLNKIIVDGENVFLTQEDAIYYSKKGCEIVSHPESVILFD